MTGKLWLNIEVVLYVEKVTDFIVVCIQKLAVRFIYLEQNFKTNSNISGSEV